MRVIPGAHEHRSRVFLLPTLLLVCSRFKYKNKSVRGALLGFVFFPARVSFTKSAGSNFLGISVWSDLQYIGLTVEGCVYTRLGVRPNGR
jgi:hypothetical protein